MLRSPQRRNAAGPQPTTPGGGSASGMVLPMMDSILDSCHRKIRLLGGAPVAFLGGLVAKARRRDRESAVPGGDEHKLYLEAPVLERRLPEIDLRVLVDLPSGLDYFEWLASHTIAFFEHINLVYGTISEFCTVSGCPDMSGPGSRSYLWFDEKGKKTRVAAPQYVDYVMTFTQKTLNDDSIFPTKYAQEFPSSFESIVKKILRLLFHVLAHIYHGHFRELVFLNLHGDFNCVFAHLMLFNRRFELIDAKETDILHDLVLALRVYEDDPTVAVAAAETAATVGATEEEEEEEEKGEVVEVVEEEQEEEEEREKEEKLTSNRPPPAPALLLTKNDKNI